MCEFGPDIAAVFGIHIKSTLVSKVLQIDKILIFYAVFMLCCIEFNVMRTNISFLWLVPVKNTLYYLLC